MNIDSGRYSGSCNRSVLQPFLSIVPNLCTRRDLYLFLTVSLLILHSIFMNDNPSTHSQSSY